MPSVDPVILKLEADIADYKRDVSHAQRLTDEKLSAIESKGTQMGQNLKKGFDLAKTAALAFVAAGAVQVVTDLIKKGLDHASALGEQAQQLGVTTNALQEYRYAASQAGLSSEEMDQALSQLTRRMGEADSGTKAQAEAFEKLGISLRDAEGKMRDAGDTIPLIAAAMQKIESPAERAAILMDLFGRAGQKLEPLLSGGAKGVNTLREAAHNLGMVLSEEQIQKADETADKLAELKMVLDAKISGAVADNADSILQLANALTTLVDKAGAAVRAWQNWRREVAAKQQEEFAKGWFISDAEKAQYLQNAQNLRAGKPTGKPRGRIGGGGLPSILMKPGGLSGQVDAYSKPYNGILKARLGPELSTPVGAGIAGGLNAIGGGAASLPAMTAELQRLAADLAMAQAELTGNLRQRAEAEKQRIDADLAADLADVEDENVKIAHRRLAEGRKQLVDHELATELARKDREAREQGFRDQLDTMRAEAEAADTRTERNEIERRILTLQQEEERARLEAAIAAGDIADAAQARANLERRQAAEGRAQSMDQEGPGARYLRGIREDAANINDAIDGIKADGLDKLNDGLVEAIMGTKSLGDVFKNVANQIIADLLRIAVQRAIIGPIASALFGGGGGGVGGLIGGLFGGGGGGVPFVKFGGKKATGGPVSAGSTYLVGENGPELLRMGGQSGFVVPNHMIGANAGGGRGSTATVRLELSGDIDARIQRVSGPVAIEVVRASAPTIIDASARETMARSARPRI